MTEIFSQTELQNLVGAGLIKKHGGSGAYILTGKGNKLLDDAFVSDILPYIQRSYRDADIQRRLNIASLLLTFYRSGADVFTTGIDALGQGPGIFLPSNTRGRGANPWANTRIAAVASMEGSVYAIHHIRSDNGKLLFADELAAFSRNTAQLQAGRQAFLFAGASYAEILSELEHREDSPGDRLIGYGEAYQRLRMDAHLVTCDTTGTLQLAIMARPDYRRRLTRLAVQSKFVPPPEDFPGCDAFYEGAPFLLAADMDLRRIDAAIQTAYERGCYPVVLAALAGQAEAVLYARYRDTGKARVFRLTDSALREFFGTDSPLYAPSHQQFLTAKGGVIDAPLIQAHRKT